MNWLFLFLAIIFETIGTTCLKMSNGFTILLPSILTIVGYIFSFYFLALALKTLDVSISYAIWGAVGIVLVSLIGHFFFHENLSPLKIFFITLIIISSVGLRLVK